MPRVDTQRDISITKKCFHLLYHTWIILSKIMKLTQGTAMFEVLKKKKKKSTLCVGDF